MWTPSLIILAIFAALCWLAYALVNALDAFDIWDGRDD